MDLKSEILQILDEARTQIVSNIDSQGIKASGKTQASLKVEDRGQSLVLVQKAEGAPFETLQYGRKGGDIPIGFNAIIKQWIIDKGIIPDEQPAYKRKESVNWIPKYTPQERNLLAAAGAMAANIKKNGTKRFSQPNENVYSDVLTKTIEKLENLMIGKITSKIRQ